MFIMSSTFLTHFRTSRTHLILPCVLLLLPWSGGEEVATPASILQPRNFNYHPYEVKQYHREIQIEPTKQGPVLFPNDGPPPPRPPLIVTSRPLTESIARSELNPIVNNSIAEQSQISNSFRPYTVFGPDYLDTVRQYKPFVYPVARFDDYGGNRIEGVGTERYNDYVDQSPLPPIYQAIADHAQQKVLKLKQKDREHQYQVKEPEHDHSHRKYHDEDQGSNYAFSYKVKDKKTGDDFSHSQQSSGSATNGEYRVRLPDGRMQIVSYTADENGYKADVRYDDEDKTTGNSIDYGHNHYRDHGHDHNNHDHIHDQVDHHKVPEHKHYNGPENILYKGLQHARHYFNDHVLGQNYHSPGHHSSSIDDNEHRDYKDTNVNDYVQNREYKPTFNYNLHANTNINSTNENYKVKEDFNQYSDLSKEYYGNDYSLEYDGQNDNYDPYKSKFSIFAPQSTNSNQNLGVIVVPNQINNKESIASTVKPSYEELKDLFLTKNLYNEQLTGNKIPVEINVPSTTAVPNSFDETTEHVVVIGTTKPNVYANRNLQSPVTSAAVSYSTSSNFVTPRNYLESTIQGLKHRNDAKPVLSPSFISRINKYLNFN